MRSEYVVSYVETLEQLARVIKALPLEHWFRIDEEGQRFCRACGGYWHHWDNEEPQHAEGCPNAAILSPLKELERMQEYGLSQSVILTT